MGKKRSLPAPLLALLWTVAVLCAIGPEIAAGGSAAAANRDSIRRFVREHEEIRIDPTDVARQVRDGRSIRLTTPSMEFDVLLEPVDVRSPEYLAEETGDDGARRPAPAAEMRTYKGSVAGMPGAQARFSVDDSRFEGIILTRGEWYFFEPLRNYTPDASMSELAVYRRSSIREDAIGICGTSLAHRIGEAHEFAAMAATELAAGSYSADVATEADYDYVTWAGGSAAANTGILDIMNQVSGIYETDLGISLRVSYQHTWTTASDPYTSTAPSTMLEEFRSHWNSNFSSNTFDLAHMWTGRDMDGSTVGIAYLGVVCNMRSYSYGISQKYSSAPGKYVLSAHEIGHNFGASHTDQASPPPTDCSNTIMNSYVGTGTAFCQFSRTEISAHVAQSSSCLVAGPAAPSSLSAVAVSGSQINLSWQDNSGNETGFRVERRLGSGSYQVVNSTASNTTSYSDTGLSSGSTYYYRVQALGSPANSSYSNEASATTQASSSGPVITGLLPSSGAAGTAVTITGTGFTGATSVKFNSTAASFTVSSATQISTSVPKGATTGKVSVTTPAGAATSASNFTVSSACDVNHDGSLSSADVQFLKQVILGSTQNNGSCDMNKDGRVNISDLQILANVVLGTATCPLP
jgi:hypothetical protein